jgi:ATP-dependent Lon protease
VKLLFPKPEMPVPDEDLGLIVRLALESRRRIKEQQKRCFKSEFRNTHFSYTLGVDGVEQFVSTPELHSDEAIESDPLPPGQVWAASMGSPEAGAGLYRSEVTSGPGGGVKILNQPSAAAFRGLAEAAALASGQLEKWDASTITRFSRLFGPINFCLPFTGGTRPYWMIRI